jgi:hypothetical protein
VLVAMKERIVRKLEAPIGVLVGRGYGFVDSALPVVMSKLFDNVHPLLNDPG